MLAKAQRLSFMHFLLSHPLFFCVMLLGGVLNVAAQILWNINYEVRVIFIYILQVITEYSRIAQWLECFNWLRVKRS